MEEHKVSVIIPVGKDHSNVSRCIRMFQEQTYQNKELIFVFDNDEWHQQKHIATHNIQVHGLYAYTIATIGRKLNFGILNAKGNIICRMDSDDVYGPEWIDMGYKALFNNKVDIVGLSNAYFLNYVPEASIADIYEYNYTGVPGKALKVCGATMMFWKNVWQIKPFSNTSEGEDRIFCEDHPYIATHNADKGQFLSIIHGGNTCSHKQLIYMRKLTERQQQLLTYEKVAENLTFGEMVRNAGIEV